MGVLTRGELRKRIYHKKEDKRLYVTPILGDKKKIFENEKQKASLDLHLGTMFLVPVRSYVKYIETNNPTHFNRMKQDSIDEIHIPIGDDFTIHPRQFILGCTLEYFGLPVDLSGYVVTRSSWGRYGLIIATAIGVHPGYRGSLTLEITNLGEVPLIISPGRRVAQLFFHTVEYDKTVKLEDLASRFHANTKPCIANLSKDEEVVILKNFYDD